MSSPSSITRCLRTAVVLLSLCSATALADYAAVSRRGVDLSGSWVLNTASSDDAEAMLAGRMAEERARMERWRRRQQQEMPRDAVPPIDADAPPPPAPTRPRGQRPWQKQRDENFRRMLGITSVLEIKQEGSRVEIVSAVESRRLEAGSHTQVSMPEGQLADSRVGWDGDWFVIERKVRSGPRALEKFRLVPKSGQLEYLMTWSGDTELAGMKIRRLFERRATPAAPPDPDSGPYIE